MTIHKQKIISVIYRWVEKHYGLIDEEEKAS